MPKPYDTSQDLNFDALVDRFKDNVYGKLKGKIRLAVLERDFKPYIEKETLEILDVGGGQAQFSLSLAEHGHKLCINDISEKMLAVAKAKAAEKNLSSVEFVHSPLQALKEHYRQQADIVICHAVLEWLAEPELAIPYLRDCLKKDGMLSLAFFNINSLVFRNLVRGNYRKVASNNFVGMEGSLTPINPLSIETVLTWCKENQFEVLEYSGIRVFHDYINDQAVRNRHPEALIEMELQYSKIEPYRSLGRYIHILAKKI
ncbi:MAG: methyltransferase domain-containing protein [Agarilytica sp.]